MLKIKEGSVYFYFCYDIAEEIKLEKLEKILGTDTMQFRLEGKRLTPEYMQYKVPPIFVRLGQTKTEIEGKKVSAILDVKLYNFGAVTIRFQAPFSGTLEELKKFSSSAEEKDIFLDQANNLIRKIKGEIEEYLIKPEKKIDYMESYAIFSAKSFSPDITASQLFKNNWKAIAKIVKQELGHMSDEELKSTVKNNLSYYANDMVIVDWNGAFVYDKTKSYDVIDVIEYAVIELLELRAYDSYLDAVLDQAYDDIEKKKMTWLLSPYISTLNNLLHVRLEVTDVVDKVENSLKLVGDPYLAKVYTITAASFYLSKWKSSVRSKLSAVESTYSALAERIQAARMMILEILVVLLFIIDLLLIYYLGV